MKEFIVTFVSKILKEDFSDIKSWVDIFWKKLNRLDINFDQHEKKQFQILHLESILLNKWNKNLFIKSVLWYAFKAKYDILEVYKYVTSIIDMNADESTINKEFLIPYIWSILKKTKLFIDDDKVTFLDKIIYEDNQFVKNNFFSKNNCRFYGFDYKFLRFLHWEYYKVAKDRWYIKYNIKYNKEIKLNTIPINYDRLNIVDVIDWKRNHDEILLQTYIAMLYIIWWYEKNQHNLELIYIIQNYWMLLDCNLILFFDKPKFFTISTDFEKKWLIFKNNNIKYLWKEIPLDPKLNFNQIWLITNIDKNWWYKYLIINDTINLIYTNINKIEEKKSFFNKIFNISKNKDIYNYKNVSLKIEKTPYDGLYLSNNIEYTNIFNKTKLYNLSELNNVIIEFSYLRRLRLLWKIYKLDIKFWDYFWYISFNPLIPDNKIKSFIKSFNIDFDIDTWLINYDSIKINIL